MIEIRTVSWELAHEELRSIRHEVFVLEQSVPAEDEWDDYDPTAIHFLATDPSGHSIGTARFLPSGKITRMAVRKPFRHRQVGSQLLTAVLNYASHEGFQRVYLDAQVTATPFYERFGFAREGEIFQDAGIDHVRMSKAGLEKRDERGN